MVVVVVVRLTKLIGRPSPYNFAEKAVAGKTHSRRLLRLVRDDSPDGEALRAVEKIDGAVVYVIASLTLLLTLFLVAPAFSGASTAGKVVSVLALVWAAWRYVDLVAYQVGILLDPRQDLLRSAPRSLVILGLNLAEVTLSCAIALYVLKANLGGTTVSTRADALVDSFNLVALLQSVRAGSTGIVAIQILTVVAAVLLLVVGIGVLLGLMTQAFRTSNDERD